jgi:quinol-cytochrome oxidoreductase complex cytochrome b subunit
VIAAVVALHVWALHVPGNGNPVGIEVKTKKDTLPFHPYYTVKDGFAIIVYLIIFAAFVFFLPNVLGHADNFIPANPLSTPAHIVPEWYYLPFYAILRAVTFDIGPIDAKLGGVMAMFGAILILFVLPWLDTSKVRSMRFRPVTRVFFILFVLACLGLGWCGAKNPDDLVFVMGHDAEGIATGFKFVWFAQLLTFYYFAYFLIVLPVMGIIEKPLDRPASIEASVLGSAKA